MEKKPNFWKRHRVGIIGALSLLIVLAAILAVAMHRPARAEAAWQIPENATEIAIPLPVPEYSQNDFIELVTQIMKADGFTSQETAGWEEQRWTRKVKDGGEQTFCLYGTHTGLTVHTAGTYTTTLSTYHLEACHDALPDRCTVTAP